MHNKEKPIDKAIKNSHSSNSYNNLITTTACGNLQTYSQGYRGRRGCESHSSHNGHQKRRTSNSILTSGANNTNKSNLSDHSKDTYFNYNKVGY